MKLFIPIFFATLLTLAVEKTHSAEKSGQARLFFGSTQVAPKNLNTELTAQGIKNVDLNNQAGVEITFPTTDKLNLGIRYTKRLISQDDSVAATDFKAEINQDVAALVARYAFLKTDVVRLEVVAGVGGSNTTYTLKSATQDGGLSKTGSPFATLYSTAGISLALGKGKFYFVLEGGMDSQKVESLERTGTMNNNVNEIDLSGAYFNIGVMFDGIPIEM